MTKKTPSGDSDYIRVSQVMTPSPVVIDGLATVADAVALMTEKSVSSLIIDRRDDGDEYGLVVMADIADKVIAPDRAPDRVDVYEIMSKPVLTVEGGMNIKYAVRLLNRFHLSRALVVEHGRLVGIVTMRDMVLRYFAAAVRA